MAKMQAQPHRKEAPRTSPEEEPQELPTELAFGSDGRIYINAKHVRPEKRKGRMVFKGYAMTPEETRAARVAIHKAAFNITVEAFQTTDKSEGE